MLYKIDKNLEFKKLPKYTKWYKMSFLLNLLIEFALLMSSFNPVILTETKIVTETDTITVIKYHDIELTDSSITAELVRLGCVLPNVALAQMKIESSHFKSAICFENKNIAGIRTSKSKYVIGKNRDHCVYNTYRDCLKDYVRIQNAYLSKIDGHYAEASGYVNLIKQFK